MYEIITVEDTVRLPPTEFGKKLNQTLVSITKELYEGVLDEDIGVIVSVTNAEKVGDGKVIPGDGGAYYKTKIKMLVYKPKIHEIVEGSVQEVTDFGAFMVIGPVEGLCHVSQIMDEYINYDSKNSKFSGKNTNKNIGLGDNAISRIVTISLKGTISDSKIGLTMRQPFLGKLEWIEKEIKNKKKKPSEKKEKNEKEEKK